MNDEDMRTFSRELHEAVEESRQQGQRLDKLAEGRQLLDGARDGQAPSRPSVATEIAVTLLGGVVGFVICIGLSSLFLAIYEPSLASDPDAPTRLVHIPRCSPAFAGAAIVCISESVAKTFSTTEAQ